MPSMVCLASKAGISIEELFLMSMAEAQDNARDYEIKTYVRGRKDSGLPLDTTNRTDIFMVAPNAQG